MKWPQPRRRIMDEIRMKSGSTTRVLVGLLFIALALPAAAATKDCKYTAAPRSTVSIVNEFGNVDVKVSSGHQVSITATPASDKVTVECNQVGSRIDAISHLQQADATAGRVDYQLAVPADVALSIRNSAGPIHVDGAGNDDTLRSDAAEVDASNLHNAHLHVVTISGPVSLRSINGGHVEVLSSGGNVTLQNVDAQRVSVSTTTGSISYDGDFGSGGEYAFNNHSGNIDVTVPSTASIDVDARSLQGSVQNDLPLHQKAVVTPAITSSSYGRSFAGTSNSGSSSVELRSFSGTIRVKKR